MIDMLVQHVSRIPEDRIATGDGYRIFNGDCVANMVADLGPDSVGLCITSPPFADLFSYSHKPEDVGNNPAGVDIRGSRFGLNFRFWAGQLLEVLEPGAVAALHIQQLIATKVQHGYMGRRDFRAAVIDVMVAAGFEWTGEVAIPKDPQIVAHRMQLHSLQFKTGKERDARALAPAANDYLMLFRKPGKSAEPVRCLHDPDTNPGGWVSQEEWIRWARGVWDDIRETDVLPRWRDARESEREKHVCLARGSLVLTREGYVPIEDVTVGAEVLTHKGRWRAVTATACNGAKAVVRMTAQGVAELRLTPDHRLWTRPGRTTHPRAFAMRADPEWMPASETLGSYVNLPLPPIEESDLLAEEWWIVGRWLGDGHLSVRGLPYLSCSHREADGLIARLGEHAGSARRTGTATQVYVKDRNGRVGGRIHDMIRRCGVGAGGKRVPVEALALASDPAEALLDGYLSADGHEDRLGRWHATSVSRALVLGMTMVAQRARGIVGSVYAGRKGGDRFIQGRAVTTRDEWVMLLSPRHISGFLREDGAWKKVRSVSDSGEIEVWDLQVDEDQSFVAEGAVVHNCPLQLEPVRRCIRLYSNPGSLVLDPFSGIGSVGWVAIEQGRTYAGFELKGSYWSQSAENLDEAVRRQATKNAPLPLFAGLTS